MSDKPIPEAVKQAAITEARKCTTGPMAAIGEFLVGGLNNEARARATADCVNDAFAKHGIRVGGDIDGKSYSNLVNAAYQKPDGHKR